MWPISTGQGTVDEQILDALARLITLEAFAFTNRISSQLVV